MRRKAKQSCLRVNISHDEDDPSLIAFSTLKEQKTCFSFDPKQLWENSFKKVKNHFKGLVTLDIFTHNIAIKRYFDKKIILSHRFLMAKVSS